MIIRTASIITARTQSSRLNNKILKKITKNNLSIDILIKRATKIGYPIILACSDSKLIVSVEEHNIIGGLGSAISEYKTNIKNAPKQLILGIKDIYGKSGNYNFLKDKHRLTPEKIIEDVLLSYQSL